MYRQFHFWISFAGRTDRICRWSDDGVDESKAPSSEVKKLASMNNEKLAGEKNSKRQLYSWVSGYMSVIPALGELQNYSSSGLRDQETLFQNQIKQKHFYICSPLLLFCLTHYTARYCLCNMGSQVARQHFTLEPLIPEPMFFIPNISEACGISLWSKTYTQKLSSKETLKMPQNTNLLLILIMSGYQLQSVNEGFSPACQFPNNHSEV